MDEKIATAEKKLLVEIVRVAQKRGIRGSRGEWKEFLNSYDKKFGASMSDPARRSQEVLAAFIKTFNEDDVKLVDNLMQLHEKRNFVEQLLKKSPDNEFPEQRLVRLTLEHSDFPLFYSAPSNDEGWVYTKISKRAKKMKANEMVAVDCEMVLCEDGSEAVVRICVVDRNLEVKINKFVKPDRTVVDFRTEITGITAGDLEDVNCSLSDVQKSMVKLLSGGTILVGHSLNNDLQALKLVHPLVIDTSLIFNCERRPSLNLLCKSVLGYEVREKGASHNCLDDAMAAMKLVLAKIDRKIDDPIPLVEENVRERDRPRLLLHRIPVHVSTEDLTRAIKGDFRIECKASKKGQDVKYYSAFAIFKNTQEADQAFDKIKGSIEKDTSGRPQKFVSFQLGNRSTATMYVRKMAGDVTIGQSSTEGSAIPVVEKNSTRKRKIDEVIEEDVKEDSQQRCDHLKEIERLKQELKQKQSKGCCDHLKEIERLKQVLSTNDREINVLHSVVTNISKGKGRGNKEKKRGINKMED